MIQKEYITWFEIEQYSTMLAERINYTNNFKYDTIVAITRGGLFVAGLLAHELDIKTIETIGVEFYTEPGQTMKEPKLLKNYSNKYIQDQNILICDDLTDSGKTMKFVYDIIEKDKPKNIRTAVLFKKPNSIFEPDYYIRITNKWLVFPYEKEYKVI